LGDVHVATVKGTVQKSQGALVRLLVHFVILYVTMLEMETNSVPYSVTYVMIPRVSKIFFI
jgi:hypothetical protein